MTERNYTDCSIEDLLHDQEFISLVKSRNTPEAWEQFLQAHAVSRNKMIQARKMILILQIREGKLEEARKSKLWNNISGFNDEISKNIKFFRLRTFVRIAASLLIILSLGGVIYNQFSRVENNYQFSESESDLKIENPMLVLSNGAKIGLGKSESKITVLKGQDAIQINNDSIVENLASADKTADEVKMNEVIIPFGKKSKIVLEDGTNVWLNAGSRFAFPQKFTGKKREVFLDGEAYFEVAKNEKQPFIVSTGDINIEVLGTKFNVSAYHSDNFCETVLLEGKVNVWEKEKLFSNKAIMAPGQKATYNKTGKEIVLVAETDPGMYIAWTEGWYQFSNQNLEQVLNKLERYYNVRFVYDPEIVSGILPVTGKLDLKDSLDAVMAVFSKVSKFNYQITDKNITINK
jgi:hypothetical protein